MAKKTADSSKPKPNCSYCIHGKDIGDHMSLCPFHIYPRSNGIRGYVQCDKVKYELDNKKWKSIKLE